MKKIIAAFDSLGFSESTLQYAVFLAKEYNAHLVGVFLRQSTRIGYAVYATIARQSDSGRSIFDAIDNADKVTMNKAIMDFEAGCRKAKINYSVHRNRKNALEELLHETAFADLLVIDARETFSYIEKNLPGWFIKNVLQDAQCPVLLAPAKFTPVKKLILLYDGSPSSIQAIKMFNYILPEMSSLETKVLTAKDDNSNLHLPDNRLMKEWMKRHHPHVTYQVLRGTEKKIVSIISREGADVIIVAGSYQRSGLSMLFHKSLADLLLRQTNAPVFIAHL
jgi:hypothetical protein